jgi:PAS domain S-box-containing protein
MMRHIRVLIVEDSEDDALLVARELRQTGYKVEYRRVDTRPEMLSALQDGSWDLVISDYAMPQFGGLAALEVYHKLELDIPFLVISGTIGEDTAVAMMKAGAHDYLMKNNLTRLEVALERELREADMRRQRRLALKRLQESEANARALLNAFNDFAMLIDANGTIIALNDGAALLLQKTPIELVGTRAFDMIPPELAAQRKAHIDRVIQTGRPEKFEDERNGRYFANTVYPIFDLQGRVERLALYAYDITDRKMAQEGLTNAARELQEAYDATLEGWSRALELRETETAGHSLRVVDLTVRLAAAMGIEEEELVHIRRGALLHDIGKMGLPDSILLKPGKLTEEEWVIMRQHPRYAYKLLSVVHYLKPALVIPFFHHERWDGSGYPHGLQGENIPLSARIFAVVDCWDALLSNRPYRPAWPEEEVFAYLRREAGKSFDPVVVDTFLAIIQEK